MIDAKLIEANPEQVKEALKLRGYEDISIDSFLTHQERRKELIRESEALRNQRNVFSKEIGKLKSQGNDAQKEMEEVRNIGGRISELTEEQKKVDSQLTSFLLSVPNLCHSSVPGGRDERDNVEVRRWGHKREFSFSPQNHWDIAEALGIIDFQRATKIAGSRFSLYQGAGARLERALINFMLDVHTLEHNYTEVLPPFIVNAESMTATGQLPKFYDDLYKLEHDDYFLIPTAEVPVTNIHRDEILLDNDLPRNYVAYTPCFRREAGSHGKDVRGLIRQHQFNKVELVKFVKPEDSYDELESLTSNAESVLQKLELPYRVIVLCTGDTGFASAKTYDIEVWLPGQGTYREISSCSNFTDFQARRGRIRFKRQGKKATELVHTLNGSGLAVGRTLVALLENFQQKDSSVIIPEALRPYMGADKISAKDR
jgi:seryl-tRNA synthetase